MNRIKKIIIVMGISLAMLFVACEKNSSKTTNLNEEKNITTSTKNEEKNLSVQKRDLTVKVKNNKIDLNNKVAFNINSEADFSIIYKNVEDLIKADTSVIVFGEISDLNYTNLKNGIYTNLSVTVIESLKGDLKVNDMISVFENGGITTYKDYIECFEKDMVKKELETNVEEPKEDELVVSHFDGTELSQKGQKVLLFLTKSEGDIIPKGSYECVGTYMGKLTLKNDRFVRTESDNNGSNIYTDTDSELKKSKVLSRIRKKQK